MTDNAIFLKTGVRVMHIVSVMLAPSVKVASEQEEVTQALKEHMTVQERQRKIDGEIKSRRFEQVDSLQCCYH